MFERLLKQQPQTDDPLKRLKKVSGYEQTQTPVQQVKQELSPITETARAISVEPKPLPKSQGLGTQALTIPSTEKVERVEQPKVSDKYAEQIKREFGYDPRKSTESFMAGFKQRTSEEKQRLGELQGQYITAKQAEDKQITSGFYGGLTMGATTELMKRGASEDVRPVVEEAVSSPNFAVGQGAGSIARYGLMYSLLGAPIESGFAKLAGKAGIDVTKGLGGRLATELAKDVVLSAPMTAAESLISGRTTDETKKAVVNDLIFGAVMNGVFEARAIGNLVGDSVKKIFADKKPSIVKQMTDNGLSKESAETIVKSVEDNTDWDRVVQEGQTLLDVRTSTPTTRPSLATDFGTEARVPDFYANQFGVADRRLVNQLQLPEPKTIQQPIRSDAFGSTLDVSDTRPKFKGEVPLSQRKNVDLADRKLKAFQHDNPEVQPYFKEKASELIDDLKSTKKGSYDSTLVFDGNEVINRFGDSRVTTETFERVLEETKKPYKEIEKALNDLIVDNGKENHATAKRIETIIDDMLTNGYRRADGVDVPPNAEYIALRNKLDPVKISDTPQYDEAFDDFLNWESGINKIETQKPLQPTIERPSEFAIRQPQYPQLNQQTSREIPRTLLPSEANAKVLESAKRIQPTRIEPTLRQPNFERLVNPTRNIEPQAPRNIFEQPTPTMTTMLDDIQKPVDVDDMTFNKFKLDLFGATKENPVDAVIDGVDVKVTSVFDEDGVKKAVLSDGRQVDYNSIKPSKRYQPKVSDEMANVFEYAKTVKDVGTTSRYTTDVYRNFERVFDKNTQAFKTVKQNILDPFDEAKGNMADDVIRYTDGLMDRIVKDLNIKPKSTESALVMRFGEGRIDYEGLVGQVGKEKADNIVKADAWFRKQYDELLDDININRINMNKPVIEKRQDYYRHFNDIANTFENLKNIFESGRAIDPRLSGLSEYTKPREAWASFKQRRTDGTKFTEDAIGGFLDYIKAATYAKHIDPQISNFRTFRNQLANSTTDTKNVNRFIEYLDDFTNDLAGKTNPFDRWLQKLIGREKLAAVNALNSRVKSNAVLGNFASSLSQIANIPQGIAIVKDPESLSKGFVNYIQSISGKGDANLYKQSAFLKERYLSDAYSKFNMRLIDKPKQAAVWTLGALDEVATKFIWSSAHAKAVKNGNLNPVKYADDITRKAVAGRGVGEVPLAQKANAMQLVAPFTVEVNNLWKVMQDMGKEKDIAGLSILFIANHLLNKGMEEVRGSGVTFDPIQAVIDGFDSESTFGDNLLGVAGSLGGEVLSNLPLGSSIASVYPEYGSKIGDVELPTRAELFGEYDPTRYGISMPIVRAIQDPLRNLVLPFGGAQVSKTLQGAQTLGLLPQNILTSKDTTEKIELPASVSRSGKIRTGVEVTPAKTAQALLFGGYSLPEVRRFFEGTGVPFGELQTSNIVKLANEGLDLVKLTSTLTEARTVNKKEERQKILEKAGYTKSEVSKIMKTFYGYKE